MVNTAGVKSKCSWYEEWEKSIFKKKLRKMKKEKRKKEKKRNAVQGTVWKLIVNNQEIRDQKKQKNTKQASTLPFNLFKDKLPNQIVNKKRSW